MKIAVAGLWHLGSVTAACMTSVGHQVVGYDEDAGTVGSLSRGQAPIHEPGLNELLQKGIHEGRLQFTSDKAFVAENDVLWIAYDTPVNDNDEADVDAVVRKVEALFPHLRRDAVVLISSQLPVGTVRLLEQKYRAIYPAGAVSFACSPENLRLGKAIDVFLNPDRVIVGVRNENDKARLLPVFSSFAKNIEWVSVESAEMIKHSINAFLATSTAFINEVALVCEQVGADAREVERGLKSDSRIGPRAYLRPGAAFAGGTLARDISFLLEIGKEKKLSSELLAGVKRSNDSHRLWPQQKLKEVLSEPRGRTVAVLGLTYKPGTDTLRRSSAVEFCRWLNQQGTHVKAFDPAVKALTPDMQFVQLCFSTDLALEQSDAALIATAWPDFKSITAAQVVEHMHTPTVLDPDGFLLSQLSSDSRIKYFAVGSPK